MTATPGAPVKPYERGESRVRALYRIPSPSGRQRVLEICCGRPPVLPGEPWKGERAVTCILDGTPAATTRAPGSAQVRADPRALPFAPASFELVMLHETLDGLQRADASWRSPAALDGLLRRLAELLTPGGVVAGCVANGSGFGRWLRGMRGSASPGGSFTIGSCKALLQRAGLEHVRVFTLIPDSSAPLSIVSTDRDLSRRAFLRELEIVRPALGLPGYVARRLFAGLALNRYLEGSLFFWGRRG